ncbi:MAG: 30S ribosomal protein S9 [Omnitrophica bacterium RIFCSPLOWO2_01_FULL_50_24]|nr:MAG: 30S ribosomal protein S9 [Omnitrophica bacterium RIFCSPLOWO2_01_FULL_50_24]
MSVAKKHKDTSSFYATGRRKSSVARVWLFPDGKDILINNAKMDQYLPRENHRMLVREPLEVTNTVDRFGVKALVKGGGLSGQTGAVQLGISRALVSFDQEFRSILRKNGLLTRDPRKKERKKYGRKKARRSYQYTKR